VRTASGIDPGFIAHRGVRPLPSSTLFFSAQASRAISEQHLSCVRLPSLADDASGTLSLRVPYDGTSLLWVPGTGEGGLDAGKVPAPGIGAAPVYSPSIFGAGPPTASAPGVTQRFFTPPSSPVTSSRGAASTSEGASQFCSSRLREGEAFVVTGARSSRRQEPAGLADPAGLTAITTHNCETLAGRAQLASQTPALFAVTASHYRTAPRTTTSASSLAAHSLLPTAAGRWPGGSGGDAPASSLRTPGAPA